MNVAQSRVYTYTPKHARFLDDQKTAKDWKEN